MSKDVKVALTGTGGDELFGNYGKFRAYEEDSIWPQLFHFVHSIRPLPMP